MSIENGLLNKAGEILSKQTPLLTRDCLDELVRTVLTRRELFLDIVSRHGSPLYIVEPHVILDRAQTFSDIFRQEIPGLELFYAVKSNHHPALVSILARNGFGLDVSSGPELELAVESGAEKIIFSGPGKIDPELHQALAHSDRVTVLLDSFGELERLDRLATEAGVTIRAGIRLTTSDDGLWRKFGILLHSLPELFATAEKSSRVSLEGIQFHTSWNLNPDAQSRFIEKLGEALKELSPRRRGQINFLDIGGGYWPPAGEWLLSAGTPEGRLRQDILNCVDSPLSHHCLPAATPETFARVLGDALKKYIYPHIEPARIFAEPGRWLCNDAMHIALTVVDKKQRDMVVTDGGNNIIGWERFETDYAPVVNLSSPGLDEHPCHIFGSLCTPHDIWGYAYHGTDIGPGHVLLIPNQGAYTWSLRQEFIKPPARAFVMDSTITNSLSNITTGRKANL